MKHLQYVLKYPNSLYPQFIPKVAFSSSPCVCGRKTRNPYDMRETMTLLGRDLGPSKPGGTKKLARDIGLRADMPQPPGIYDKKGRFHFVPEMVPEFIVPDLTNFKLKPYVSYRVPDVKQSEFTAKDLFDATYGKSVVEKWNRKQLDLDDVKVDELVKKP